MNIYVDGSGKRPGSYCFLIPEKHIVRIFHQPIDKPITNNQAEYKAIISALEYIQKNKEYLKLEFLNLDINIYSDSLIIINQLDHSFAIKSSSLRKLAIETWKLCEGLNVNFNWVRRKENKAGKILG